MSGQEGLSRFRRRRLLQAALFSGRVRSAAAVACCLLLLQFLWAPLEAAPGRQLRPLKQVVGVGTQSGAIVKEFTVAGNGKFVVELTLASPGRIKATADWSGTAGRLALILNGPGMAQYYARRDGRSPLVLEFEVTQELLAKGAAWRLSVANFEAGSSAQGTVKVELPAGGTATAQTQPQAAAGTVQAAGGAAAAQARVQEKTGTEAAKAAGEKVSTAARPAAQASPQRRTGLLGTRRQEAAQAAVVAEDVTPIREFMQERIKRLSAGNKLGGMLVPLFFKYVEEVAANPRLLRQYYQESSHRKAQTENDLRLYFQWAAKAYREIPQEFKTRYLHPEFVNLAGGQKLDVKRFGADIIHAVRPGLPSEVKQVVRSAFSGRFLVSPDAVRVVAAAPSARRAAGVTGRAAVKQTTAVQQRSTAVEGAVGRGAALRSASGLAALRDSLRQSGVELPERAGAGGLAAASLIDPSAMNSLPSIDGKRAEVDYYRYKVTLDWFNCTNKNETSADEPYFGVITTLPQFDAADPSLFKYLKDGCLNWTAGYTTRTYGGVKRNRDYGIKGDDRVIFDFLTFNSPASFTVQLWEEDYSKGSVSDGLRLAVMDIMRRIQNDIKAAVMSQIQAYIADAILSAGGVDSSAAFKLFDQVFTDGMSFADFQSMLFNLYSGRAFDASWYLIYFIFSGGDFLQTLAMIGGGSTVLGAIFLGLAVFGPAVADMFEGFFSGDVGKGLWNLFKIITVIPLLVDFFKNIFTDFADFFRAVMAWLDPDDYLGEKTVVIEKTSADWQNDARDGEWNVRNTIQLPVNEAEAFFKRNGFGPTYDNSSFVWNNLFCAPLMNIKKEAPYLWPPGTDRKYVASEYNIYYEVKREVAGGRTTFGYWFPSTPALNCKTIAYKSKSSPDAWWTNIIRVTVMSLTTDHAPWVVMVNEKTGQSFYSLSGPVFEFEAAPGVDYTLYLTKLTEGETAGYVSVYEGPVREIKCPPPGEGVKQTPGGGGAPTGSAHERKAMK